MRNDLAGLIITGISSTYMFDGGQAYELIMLDLSDGTQVTMPVLEEQAEAIMEILHGQGEDEVAHGPGGQEGPVAVPTPHLAAVPDAHEDALPQGDAEAMFAGFSDPEEVPQYQGGEVGEV